MGLKVGLYSTPWITSYAGFPGGSTDTPDGSFPDSVRNDKRRYRRIGTFLHEDIDARQFAHWGIDYLKYDWRIDLPSAERMSQALRHSGRDIVYSLSNSAPFAQAADWKRIANLWRTGPDIRDSWHALYNTVFTLDRWAPFAGPGHWNDPDMMVLGQVTTGSPMHPTRLTPDEQYSEVSMFALLSAPMLIGCPIEKLDAFTLSLLTNAEVIAIDQDPLGSPARPHARADGVETWVKRLQDGGIAIGLFHTADYGRTPQSHFRWGDEAQAEVTLDTRTLGIPDGALIRDLWRQHDIGTAPGRFAFSIPHHGVVLLRTLSPQAR
jgi:alpha-galactosidase